MLTTRARDCLVDNRLVKHDFVPDDDNGTREVTRIAYSTLLGGAVGIRCCSLALVRSQTGHFAARSECLLSVGGLPHTYMPEFPFLTQPTAAECLLDNVSHIRREAQDFASATLMSRIR
jgi:hypothetical protein